MPGAYSLGYGKRSGDVSDNSKFVPGPGQYESGGFRKIRKDVPKFSMGKAGRQPIQPKSVIQNPGPGQYSVPSKIAETAKFSFGLKHNDGRKFGARTRVIFT